MEATAPPLGRSLQPPRPDLAIDRDPPEVSEYLAAYREIGGPFHWDSRLRVPESQVARWLAKQTSDVRVLRLAGTMIGLCEFDCANPADIELVHFGIAPRMQGLGLGRYLLDQALRDCWRIRQPRRVWLHTDTNDHPRATGVYASMGFRPYLTRIEQFDD